MIESIVLFAVSLAFAAYALHCHRVGVAPLRSLRLQRKADPQGFYIAVGFIWLIAASVAIAAVLVAISN